MSSGTVPEVWPGQLTSETVGREARVTDAGVVSEVAVVAATTAGNATAVGTAAYKSAYESQAPMRANANDKGKCIIQLADLTPGPWVLQC